MGLILTEENDAYLREQIITYLGNKRALLDFIGTALSHVLTDLNKPKLDVADIFSGSGIVARYMKRCSDNLYVNDLEGYCRVINSCYLSNISDIDIQGINDCYASVMPQLREDKLREGIITKLYAPADDTAIQPGERVFYTHRNAMYLDTARQLIESIPEEYKVFLLGPLLYEASVHNNTSGVFKGFHKDSKGIGKFGGRGENALTRILGNIELKLPVFSNFNCNVTVYQTDANQLIRRLPHVDVMYIDPPYNQHPYGSNYFMLNLLCEYTLPDNISKVSGIPVGWNKSRYNKKRTAEESLRQLCKDADSEYLLISFSSEGFMNKDDMTELLSEVGEIHVFDKEYNTFRGCRNLQNRELHLKEYLYLVKKY